MAYTTENPIVIVTPIFEDQEASRQLFVDLKSEFDNKMIIVGVDDGSVRQPLDSTHLSNLGIKGSILKLKRNVGHQRAIAIGLSHVAQAYPDHICVVMDSDGEDVPASIPELLSALEAKDVDIAVSSRKSRVESKKFKLGYEVYKSLFRSLTGKSIDFGNFCALKPQAVKRLSVMQETSIHVAASILASRLRIKRVKLDRGERYAGQSKMNTVGLVLHGFRAIMIFAENVIIRLGVFAGIFAVLCIALIFAVIMLKVIGLATPGWFSVSLGILILILFQIAIVALVSLLMTGVIKFTPVPIPDNLEMIDAVLESKGT